LCELAWFWHIGETERRVKLRELAAEHGLSWAQYVS
jgi:hypothetical protein